MNVTSVKVSFSRSKQPAQYESANPAVEFVATLEEGATNHLAMAASLMYDAQQVVYGGLGLDVPEAPATKLGALEVPLGDGGTVVEGVQAAPAASTGAAGGGKRRGRPPIVKAPATVPATVTPPATATAPVDNIRTNPEDRRDPASEVPADTKPAATAPATPAAAPAATAPAGNGAVMSDIPAATPAPAAQPAPVANGTASMTAQDLQKFITDNVQAKKITVQAVKDKLAKFGAARTIEVAPEKIPELYKEIVDVIDLNALNA